MESNYKLTPLALILSSVSLNSFAANNEFDWSGPYYGGMLSYSATKTKSNVNYGNNGANPIQGWNSNQFHGDVYNSVNSMTAADAEDYMGETPVNSSMPNPSNWLSELNNDKGAASLNIFVGNSKQFNQVVLGGELRAAFGNFGATTESVLSSSGTKTGSFSDYEGAQVTFTNYNSVISGISSPVTDWQGINYSATYEQSSTQTNKIDFNNSNSAIGRIGYSFGRVMFYGLGGLAFSNVKASTSSVVNESVTGTIGTIGPTTSTAFTGQATYNFSGQNSKNMFGYSLGTGLEWAIKDNVILRIEAEYHNLGHISVTGTSSQTAASYNVKQEVYGHNLSTGIAVKF